MNNQEIRAELQRYCLANYENGFDIAIETFTETDWAYIVGKARGSFAKAVEVLKDEIGPHIEQREEIEATIF